MQMSTLKGWHGGHLEEAPKGELKHLTQKGMFAIHIYYTLHSGLTVRLLICHLATIILLPQLNLKIRYEVVYIGLVFTEISFLPVTLTLMTNMSLKSRFITKSIYVQYLSTYHLMLSSDCTST